MAFLRQAAARHLQQTRDLENVKLEVVKEAYMAWYPSTPLPPFFDNADGKVVTGVTQEQLQLKSRRLDDSAEDSKVSKLASAIVELVIDYQLNPQCPKRNIFAEDKHVWDGVDMLVLEDLKDWSCNKLFGAPNTTDTLVEVRARIGFLQQLLDHQELIFPSKVSTQNVQSESKSTTTVNESLCILLRHIKSFILEDRCIPTVAYALHEEEDSGSGSLADSHQRGSLASLDVFQQGGKHLIKISAKTVVLSIPSLRKFCKVDGNRCVTFVDDADEATAFQVEEKKLKSGITVYGFMNTSTSKYLFAPLPRVAVFHGPYAGARLYCPYPWCGPGEKFLCYQDNDPQRTFASQDCIIQHVANKNFCGFNKTGEFVKMHKQASAACVFRMLDTDQLALK